MSDDFLELVETICKVLDGSPGLREMVSSQPTECQRSKLMSFCI